MCCSKHTPHDAKPNDDETQKTGEETLSLQSALYLIAQRILLADRQHVLARLRVALVFPRQLVVDTIVGMHVCWKGMES